MRYFICCLVNSFVGQSQTESELVRMDIGWQTMTAKHTSYLQSLDIFGCLSAHVHVRIFVVPKPFFMLVHWPVFFFSCRVEKRMMTERRRERERKAHAATTADKKNQWQNFGSKIAKELNSIINCKQHIK